MSYTTKSPIKCCKSCVPPKRYPGCHGICPEYRAERAVYDAEKAEINKVNALREALDAHAIASVERAKKNRKGRS